jgi:hypothetical protein
LNQEDINNLNRSITSNEIEAAIKSPKKENSGPDRLSAEVYWIFEEQIPTLLKLFHKIEREETCLTHFIKPVLYSSQKRTRT